MHGSVDTLLSSVSKPNSGRSVVLDRVDVFVDYHILFQGFVVVVLTYPVVSETR